MKQLKRLFVITGDASGDVHGSFVIRQLQARYPSVEIEAIGGEQIASTGIRLLENQRHLGVLGLGVLSAIPSHYRLGKQVLTYLKTWRPNAVLLIDYGVFNLWIAKHLKAMGIKVFYYIPPQVWASRRWRLKTIKRYVDHVFCIFPFEEALYRSEGIPVTFVGHPLVEQLPPPPDKTAFCREHGLDPALPIIGVFPGSRASEIRGLLQPMIGALPLIYEQNQGACQFVLARSQAVSQEVFEAAFVPVGSQAEALPFKIVTQQNHAILALSQAALVASGTVTLEAALYKTPVVIAYKLSWLAYPFFKVFAYVKHIGLPNLLANQAFLPELMMNRVNPQALAGAIQPYLTESEEYKTAQQTFSQITERLGTASASVNVVEGLAALMQAHKQVAL